MQVLKRTSAECGHLFPQGGPRHHQPSSPGDGAEASGEKWGFLGPIPKVLISLASRVSGHCSPGGPHAHPSEDILCKSWDKSKLRPGGNISCGCPREEREEWRPSWFVFVLHLLLNK